MLVEVQALLSDSPFNNPRRMATGIDSKAILLLAVLERKPVCSFTTRMLLERSGRHQA